jgi:MoCo/4Fe-4S cofactor protein with predicted Tat translocation signal
MKTIPPQCPEPEVGPKYWRSLDQVAETPEFRNWVEKEFPAGASELSDPVSRRSFMKLMSASFLLAGFGLTGCRRPEENILPFGKQPEGYIHGKPVFYASSRPTKSGAVPLLVKSMEGRPVKVEGNKQHPDSNGGTDIHSQSSILDLYDPDRSMGYRKVAKDSVGTITRSAATDVLSEIAADAAKTQGDGLAILLQRSSSPTRIRVLADLKKKFPKAGLFVHEPVDPQVATIGASAAFGKSVRPYYRLDSAKAIAAFDCDFLGGEEDSAVSIRRFAKGRKTSSPTDEMNRLYVVEGIMTVTGINADHRLRTAPSQIVPALAKLASVVFGQISGFGAFASASAAISASFPAANEKWVAECAADLVAHKGAALVLVGQGQPLVAHVLANAINVALGAVGQTVEFLPADDTAFGSIADLAQQLNSGKVASLVIAGGNPAYDAPADLDFPAAAAKASKVVRLGYYEDETTKVSGWHLTLAHYLESWGDGRTSDGTLVPVQPLIAPLFDGMTELELLARVAGLDTVRPYDLVRDTFRSEARSLFGITVEFNLEEEWKRFLHDGFMANSAAKPVAVSLSAPNAALLAYRVPPAPADGRFELVFHRDNSVDDGRYANNGWLQELPDPVGKYVWENVIAVSATTAKALKLKITDPKNQRGTEKVDHTLKSNESTVGNDVVTVTIGGREITGPAWEQPGLADNVIAVALGYGRQIVGRVGRQAGFNAYLARTWAAPFFAAGAVIKIVDGKFAHIATTQEHGAMEGRPIVREATLANWKKKEDFARNFDIESHGGFITKTPVSTAGGVEARPAGIYQHPYEHFSSEKGNLTGPRSDRRQIIKSEVHQWGMVVDLSSCVGCSACMVACQSENNIPIVGKDQVIKGREMHWLRLDRYYAGGIEDPQVVTQPMMCQHCENAPCESVCPVNATVHDEEGLNVMAYNRCIGTRYCSNNCPYKARRFNFFDYNKRENDYAVAKTDARGSASWFTTGASLYKGPFGVDKNKSAEWEIIKLGKNPNVTVRMRGVMEKCTMCVQRIEEAKINQKVKAGPSGDVQVPEGTFTTACSQACPADAIVFGNLIDPESAVSKLRKHQRNYEVLGFLETRPRVTYLARIRNPNPKMPDAYELSFTTKEYEDKYEASPFEGHGHGPEHAEGGEAPVHGSAAEMKGEQH